MDLTIFRNKTNFQLIMTFILQKAFSKVRKPEWLHLLFVQSFGQFLLLKHEHSKKDKDGRVSEDALKEAIFNKIREQAKQETEGGS